MDAESVHHAMRYSGSQTAKHLACLTNYLLVAMQLQGPFKEQVQGVLIELHLYHLSET